jgi:hypothetical protein
MKIISNSAFLIGIFMFYGCTQVRDEQVWNIKNDSSTDIYIEFMYDNDAVVKLDTIESGTDKMIYYKDGLYENEDPMMAMQYSNLKIYNSQDTLVKDENDNDNWTVTSTLIYKKNDVYRYDYEFSVANSDF